MHLLQQQKQLSEEFLGTKAISNQQLAIYCLGLTSQFALIFGFYNFYSP
jgi:hypothetical protein